MSVVARELRDGKPTEVGYMRESQSATVLSFPGITPSQTRELRDGKPVAEAAVGSLDRR